MYEVKNKDSSKLIEQSEKNVDPDFLKEKQAKINDFLKRNYKIEK